MFRQLYRKVVSAALVSALVLYVGPVPQTHASAFVGATEFTQILNNVQLVESYIEQAQYVQTQFQQYATQLQQMQTELQQAAMLPQQFFNLTKQDMLSLQNVVQGGHALSYGMSNMDDQFQARFSAIGYQPTTNYQQRYTTWSQTSQDSTQKALDAANLQNSQLSTETSLLTQLQSQAQSADGQMEALQVGNQIAAMEVDSLMKLRQLMMADMQSKSAFQMQQLQMENERQRAAGMFQANSLFVNSGGIHGANK